MKKATTLSRLILVALLVTVVVFGTVAWAGKGGKPKPQPCKNWNIFCLDVWDPVVCDDGKTYSNQCYADRACATGCVPSGGGGGPIEL